MAAVKSGKVDMVKLLLENRAKVDVQNVKDALSFVKSKLALIWLIDKSPMVKNAYKKFTSQEKMFEIYDSLNSKFNELNLSLDYQSSNSMWVASIVDRLKSIGTRRSSKVDGFDSIGSIPDGIQAPPNDKTTTWSLFKRSFRRSRRVTPYVVKPEDQTGPWEDVNPHTSSAASAASTSVAGEDSIGSKSVTPRRSNEGPKTLPKSIQGIFDDAEYTIDSYLNNIQNLSFGVQDKDSGGAASSNVDYWQFLKHIITLPLGINESEVEKSGVSTSTDGITTENANPEEMGKNRTDIKIDKTEEMEEIRTEYIRDTLTQIADHKAYIETNNSQQISELVRLAMKLDNASVLVELVKVLDKNGITQVFEACKTYLMNLGDQNLEEKQTLKTALDQLLQNNDQMKLSWTGKSSGSSPNNDDRWESFKAGCIQLSKDFYAKEYAEATEDIDNYLRYIQTDKEKNAAKEDEAAESQKETEGFTPINYPGAFTLLRLINEGKFEPIKTELNDIGGRSVNIRGTTNSAVSERLVYQIYEDLDKDEFKSLDEHLRLTPKGDG